VAATPVAIRAGATVPQDVQEIVVLTVSREAMAASQWGVHVLRARDVGVSETVIRGINQHNLGSMEERDRSLVVFAASVYHQCSEDVAIADIGLMFGERGLVELTVLVAFTTMMIQIVKAFDTQPRVEVDIPLAHNVNSATTPPSFWFS
jgi:hypothetical protein